MIYVLYHLVAGGYGFYIIATGETFILYTFFCVLCKDYV